MEHKTLVNEKICVSFSEARRVIASMSPEKIEKLIEKNKYGRRPSKNIRKFAYPKSERSVAQSG